MADDDGTAEEHTGGMIAFLPSEKDAEALVLTGPNAEPVEELHATIAYLGDDVTGWDLDARRVILDAVVNATSGIAPVEARVMGHATFNPDGGPSGDGMEREPCAVYLVGDSAALRPLRDNILALAGDPPVELPEQHEPNVWHITAGYGLQAADLSFTGDVTFDRIAIAFGPEWTIVPLAELAVDAPVPVEEPPPVTAAGPTSVHMDIRVVAPDQEQLGEFVGLCKTIESLGGIGASRTIRLDVDGDGAARLQFDYGDSDVASVATPGEDSDFDDDIVVSIGA